MTIVVFSKDRALQLDAFLRSYERWVWPQCNIDVVYLATSDRHRAAYQQVFARHRCAFPREQADFKATLLSIFPPEGFVVFFVDDQVFIRPWRVEQIGGLSLRLAPHLTRCYPMNAEQAVPSFLPLTETLQCWRWADGQGDWGYPLSLDGHVFDLEEFGPILEGLEFHSPNTLEAALFRQALPRYRDRSGICYRESRVVNVPWNTVQRCQTPNRCAEAMSPDAMLERWEAGEQIALEALYGIVNESCHQEFPLVLERRV
jgi:hypothetical protein